MSEPESPDYPAGEGSPAEGAPGAPQGWTAPPPSGQPSPPGGYGSAPPQGYQPPGSYGSPGYPPPGYPPPAGHPGPYQWSPASASDETTWGVLAHLSFFVLGLIAPLVILLTSGERSPFVRAHAAKP